MLKRFLVGGLVVLLIGSTLLLGYLLSPPPPDQLGRVQSIQIAGHIGHDFAADFQHPGHKARAV